MNPTTPANSGSAMAQGGRFMRPGAVAWGSGDTEPVPATMIEDAVAAAARNPRPDC
jgi:hypothetical protein